FPRLLKREMCQKDIAATIRGRISYLPQRQAGQRESIALNRQEQIFLGELVRAIVLCRTKLADAQRFALRGEGDHHHVEAPGATRQTTVGVTRDDQVPRAVALDVCALVVERRPKLVGPHNISICVELRGDEVFIPSQRPAKVSRDKAGYGETFVRRHQAGRLIPALRAELSHPGYAPRRVEDGQERINLADGPGDVTAGHASYCDSASRHGSHRLPFVLAYTAELLDPFDLAFRADPGNNDILVPGVVSAERAAAVAGDIDRVVLRDRQPITAIGCVAVAELDAPAY